MPICNSFFGNQKNPCQITRFRIKLCASEFGSARIWSGILGKRMSIVSRILGSTVTGSVFHLFRPAILPATGYILNYISSKVEQISAPTINFTKSHSLASGCVWIEGSRCIPLRGWEQRELFAERSLCKSKGCYGTSRPSG